MLAVAITLLPALAALLLFGLIVIGRRTWRGEQAVQAADKPKIALVLGHVMPLLAACVLYNAIVAMQGDIRLEFAALCVVVLALGISIYRYLEVVDEQAQG